MNYNMKIQIRETETLIISIDGDLVAAIDNPTPELIVQALSEHLDYDEVTISNERDYDSLEGEATIQIHVVDEDEDVDDYYDVVLRGITKYGAKPFDPTEGIEIDDIIRIGEEMGQPITIDEAYEIMQSLKDTFDMEIGMNWQVVMNEIEAHFNNVSPFKEIIHPELKSDLTKFPITENDRFVEWRKTENEPEQWEIALEDAEGNYSGNCYIYDNEAEYLKDVSILKDNNLLLDQTNL